MWLLLWLLLRLLPLLTVASPFFPICVGSVHSPTGAKYCKNNPSEYNQVLSTALVSYQKASEVQGRLGEHEERVKSLRGIAGVRCFVVLVVAHFFF